MRVRGLAGYGILPAVSDQADEARREEEEARERLREAQAEAKETLEEAEELERPDLDDEQA
jgi:hypothetical protein